MAVARLIQATAFTLRLISDHVVLIDVIVVEPVVLLQDAHQAADRSGLLFGGRLPRPRPFVVGRYGLDADAVGIGRIALRIRFA